MKKIALNLVPRRPIHFISGFSSLLARLSWEEKMIVVGNVMVTMLLIYEVIMVIKVVEVVMMMTMPSHQLS